MRPAQKAPENTDGSEKEGEVLPASMRPAQKAPENHAPRAAQIQAHVASMRPAQKAPENTVPPPGLRGEIARFNEAGAKSAGKP